MQNRKNLRALVALKIISGFKSRRVINLLKNEEDLERIFSYGKSKLRTIDGVGEASALSILTFDRWDEVDKIIDTTEKLGYRLLTITDNDYPPLLKQIYDPPVIIWLKGNVEALSKPGVAVVGTRNPTAYGKKMAEKISSGIAEQGLCIFSGLAYGIDALAHKAALEAKAPTVAVLGSGIDRIYPAKNKALAEKIIDSGGAVISEFTLGTKPDAINFPVRNRIVSGMSLGVLVVESGLKGGSMITADLGLDQNREVFAIPHSLENLSGAGCNYLIKKGSAKLVQTVDDILEELPVEKANQPVQKQEDKRSWREAELDELSRKICEKLEAASLQVDELADVLKMDTSQLLVTLLQLEMDEIVRQRAGKVFELVA